MPGAKCFLELYVDGKWHVAAEVRCDDVTGGVRSPTRLEYDFDYLDAFDASLGAVDSRAVSCRYPVGYQIHSEDHWPAFLLDIIPSGAARRFWEAEVRLPNSPSSDWPILVSGGGNPTGNLRVADTANVSATTPTHPTPSLSPAANSKRLSNHEGFAREDVLARAEGFIEYARAQGASIAGGSGAAGDAPKFLLREDKKGRWHADGALDDARTERSWIVKFPRSPRSADRLVLEAEAPYYRVAARLGARVAGPVTWERDCLFIPRFDRRRTKTKGKERSKHLLLRLGMESLCSLVGVSDFGVSIPKESQAAAVARFTSDPEIELRELLLRDVLDVALGNTDNHARNTAVLKDEAGEIALTPLYDFAPMVLDPQGIPRVSRWKSEQEGFPIWSGVAEMLDPLGLDSTATKAWLHEMASAVAELPAIMRDEHVPQRVIEILERRIARVAHTLAEVHR